MKATSTVKHHSYSGVIFISSFFREKRHEGLAEVCSQRGLLVPQTPVES